MSSTEESSGYLYRCAEGAESFSITVTKPSRAEFVRKPVFLAFGTFNRTRNRLQGQEICCRVVSHEGTDSRIRPGLAQGIRIYLIHNEITVPLNGMPANLRQRCWSHCDTPPTHSPLLQCCWP